MVYIGSIQKTANSLSCFIQWNIEEDYVSSLHGDFSFNSPDFEFSNATWYLSIRPNHEHIIRYISLYLTKRGSRSSEHFVTVTISIRDRDGDDYVKKVFPHLFVQNEMRSFPYFLKRSEFLNDKWKIASNGSLIICCTLEQEEKQEVQQTEAFTSIDENKQPKLEDKLFDGKEILRDSKGVDKMANDFKDLLLNEYDCDVTLKVGTRELRAHKLILAARSPVFCSMFKHDTVEKSTGMVDIIDCDPDAFQDFLLYLYSGRCEKISTSTVLDLYFVADKYGVDELKSECVEFMEKEMSVDIFGDVIALAVRHNEPSLMKTATAFFTNHIKEIIVTVKWQSFIAENPIAANELHIKALKI